jgi:hypothetical protein
MMREFTDQEIKAMPTRRKDAQEAGATHYYTGKTCKYGHTVPRHTKTGQCIICLERNWRSYERTPQRRKVQGALMKRWRSENPDYHREYNYKPENAWRLYLARFKWMYKGRFDHWTDEDFAKLEALFEEKQRLIQENGSVYAIQNKNAGKKGKAIINPEDFFINETGGATRKGVSRRDR